MSAHCALASLLVQDFTYAISMPAHPDHLYVGEAWAGPVPSRVLDGVAVGHLLNDGATIDVPPRPEHDPLVDKR